MRRNLLSIILALQTIWAFGQLTYEPNPFVFTADTSVVDATAKFTVTNNSNQTVEWHWVFEVIDAPAGWEFQICDENLCYLPGRFFNSCNSPNILDAGMSTTNCSLHYYSNGIVGTATVQLRITSECQGDATTNIVVVEANLNADGTSSSQEVEISSSDLSVYPNPTAQYFMVKNDLDIKEVEILQIVGKRVRSEKHTAGQKHYIDDLPNGFYIVRLKDRNNNVKKVLRITKE